VSDFDAELEAAFQVALVQNAAMRALCEVSAEMVVKHSWKLGYLAGRMSSALKSMEARNAK
jgi:hypothetical protein